MDRITSKDNTKIKYVAKLLNSSDFRKKEGLFVAEGVRLCHDALLSDIDIYSAFFTEDMVQEQRDLCKQISSKVSDTFIVSQAIMQKISTTKAPQGITLVCRIPNRKEIDFTHNIILLESIQNPLNMGTIFRSAEAFGLRDIIISGNSCDIYSPKVVRGSMGGVMRLNITFEDDTTRLLKQLKGKITTCATVPNSNAVSITDISFNQKNYLMAIGNEANGLKDETIALCDMKVTIPMSGKAESLNAATSASILIWEMMKTFKP